MPQFPGAPLCTLVPGAPPYDGISRASGVSPAMCLRFDLGAPVVEAALRATLTASFPTQIGTDGALYEFGIASRSQQANSQSAVLELAVKVAAASKR